MRNVLLMSLAILLSAACGCASTGGRTKVANTNHMFSFGSGPWERGGGIGATKEVRLDCVEISRVAP